MKSDEAFSALIAFSLTLFLVRPMSGMFMDAFRVMLKLGLAGIILLILPINVLQTWSTQAVGWAHVTGKFVPVVALMALIALSTANLIFLSGTRVEEIAKLVLYVVGGTFTAGNADYLAFDRSILSVAKGVFGLVTSIFTMFGHVLS